MFNAIQFFEDFNIPIPGGKNTTPGWINIQCPFCTDTSNHLGFNIKENYFNCWKCINDNGTGYHSIYDVIKKLVPNENINYILKTYNFKTEITEKINKKKNKNIEIKLPGGKLKSYHNNYLLDRGFNPNYLETKYKLVGTNHLGDYKYRIIAPIYFQGKLVSYQGRDITGQSEQRYKACSKDKEIIHHKHILYNLDNCKKDFVVVTEGITDVWRLGDNSCCTFGKGYRKEQLLLLRKFKRVFVFFDPDEAGIRASRKLCNELDSIGIEAFQISHNTDPGEMTKKEVKNLFVKF